MWYNIIEQSVYKNGSFLETTKNDFRDWGNGVLALETVDTKKLTNDYITRMRYSAYDNDGNPLTVSKEGDTKHTYLWGYSNMYPVAEITNTDYATAIQYVNPAVLQNPSS
jgi:hypothetical protein